MSDLLGRLADILRELDQECPLKSPVVIERDLQPLFKKHAKLETVTFVPVAAKRVAGLHLGRCKDGRVTIVFKRCELHYGRELDPACPGCQDARFEITKEIAHSLDGEHEKTSPDEAADKLLVQVVKKAWEGPQAYADGVGGICALELLVRYRVRSALLGSSSANPSLRLTMAKATDNYSELARQFAVPPDLLKHAFSDDYMNAMKGWRLAHGLSVDPAPFE